MHLFLIMMGGSVILLVAAFIFKRWRLMHWWLLVLSGIYCVVPVTVVWLFHTTNIVTYNEACRKRAEAIEQYIPHQAQLLIDNKFVINIADGEYIVIEKDDTKHKVELIRFLNKEEAQAQQ